MEWFQKSKALNSQFHTFKQIYKNIQSGGSFSQQRVNGIKTKHPEALITAIAAERAIVEALEQQLKTMPNALRRAVQKNVRKLRKTVSKQKIEGGYALVSKSSGEAIVNWRKGEAMK